MTLYGRDYTAHVKPCTGVDFTYGACTRRGAAREGSGRPVLTTPQATPSVRPGPVARAFDGPVPAPQELGTTGRLHRRLGRQAQGVVPAARLFSDGA